MRLKKIKLAGFKSFVEPTNIPFPHDMMAVVGPNGCGKSNVIDAVRWVLGESSAKNLRGDAMTDVIFNGSSSRKPVSQCTVELTFDNSSGRIQGEYANYNELSVKRLVNRDAQSIYYLNGTKCRRRDVTDLFLGTGLGPRSYAIIEQGTISRLIESRPQELRVFIEEAAGISKYKERRKETETRIRHCRENLERLDDIRSELGQQLDKLQRQATAARKYKELKVSERRLKGQLAAIRWLKVSGRLSELDATIKQQEVEIEAFIAEQRGGEKGITEYKLKQQELQHKLADMQKRFYQLGTDITRLEQNQIHSKQRQQQIEHELSNIHESLSDVEEQMVLDTELVLSAESEQEEVLPQQEEVLEQIALVEEQLSEAEERWRASQQRWQHKRDMLYQNQQLLQGKQSQQQATQSLEARTRERIKELKEELAQFDFSTEEAELDALNAQCDEAMLELEQVNEYILEVTELVEQSSQQLEEAKKKRLTIVGEHQSQQAKKVSLETLMSAAEEGDESRTEWLKQANVETANLWNVLKVNHDWQVALETVLSHWKKAWVVEQKTHIEPARGMQFFYSDDFTESKPEGTLASKVLNDRVPAILTQIKLSEDAASHNEVIADGESWITTDGHWFGADWAIYGVDENQTSMLATASELSDVAKRIEQLDTQIGDADQSVERCNQALVESKEALKDAEQQQRERQSAWMSTDNRKKLFEQKQAQKIEQREKLKAEIERQQMQLEEEALQLEELGHQIEELAEKVENQKEELESISSDDEQQQSLLQNNRQQLQQLTAQKHQIALKLQTLTSQLQSLRETQNRNSQQKQTLVSRQQQLSEEFQELSEPLQDHAEQLEVWLLERQELEENQRQQQQALNEVDHKLREFELGQQDVLKKVDQMRAAVQSHKLEYEGFNVRAKNHIEQLQEIDQNLKEVLESLPEETDEDEWHKQLEKTGQSLSRLGAVNLAAVEEYEVQNERKQHLDTQNDDLIEALETLETAIRKIDKETRSRFRTTFDKVNDDLKALFPKVFGGGAAYLELTDDDLLDTGVTIMARPPGKKNSTIHLLSGGEKALTALSLVFAIFRLNPAPFCLLDEVDAPLDDANVGRFCKLVSEMSKTVQFIYITHNKIAMEMATHLTGVTMAEPGVSRMVAVDVEEAIALAEV
ncbi:chromosome segregation protein SMC [Alteromonadaceae bacterium M269]|nr:chromosome segregation protein SMC [Alteromonadaceae bacterium M269]